MIEKLSKFLFTKSWNKFFSSYNHTIEISSGTKMKLNDHIFSEGNTIRGKKTGKVYTVKQADLQLGFAFVEDLDGNLRTIDWWSGSGVVNDDVLNSYELITTTN